MPIRASRRSPREARRYNPSDCSSGRTPFERDRDRILYTTALRRLAGVTQVIAPDEGHIVHNRLTHVLEVAQIGRRLAERLNREQKNEVKRVGGINPDVVEAAALAHDLGHPPFGHIAEDELDQLVVSKGVPEGFEGNAQSFRVVTKLAVRTKAHPGLDLTAATLAATLKYPWVRAATGKKHKKFGAYSSELEDLKKARALETNPDRQTPEAALMDLADDIAYSLSDLEDFIRAGKIPIGKLVADEKERDAFVEAVLPRLTNQHRMTSAALKKRFKRLVESFPIEHGYEGTIRERANLRNVTGALMDDYIRKVTVNVTPEENEPYIRLPDELRLEIALLKHLTFHYVICDPALAILQRGQRAIIRGLFHIFFEAAVACKESERAFFPKRLTEALQAIPPEKNAEQRRYETVRSIADFIAGMSDREAVDLYQRLQGFSARSLVRASL